MADHLPANARSLPPAEASADELFRRLERFHGINPYLASDRLHELKKKLGFSPDDNVIFDFTGNVYDPGSLERLGSLCEGGARR
jgi:hypothetical protein